MAEVKNAFIKSKMNKDLDARLLPNGEYREGFNIQVSKSEGADVGALENVLGNQQLVDFKALSGVSTNLQTIGTFTDGVTNNIYVFLTDYTDTGYETAITYNPTANNFLYVYNILNQETHMLLSGAFLNFSTTNPILNVNLLEGMLFWTDNRNQPRRINTNRALINSTSSLTNSYYINEDQISVATYNPYQAIDLYFKKWGYANVGTTAVTADANVVIDKSTLVGLPTFGATVSGTGITGNPTIIEYVEATSTIKLSSTQTIAAGVKLEFYVANNFNDSDATQFSSMFDATSPKEPDGTTANPTFQTANGTTTNYPGDPDFLEDKFVRFSYRFKYEDGEDSIMAPFTQAAFIPKQDGYFLNDYTASGASPATIGNTQDETAAYRSTEVAFMSNKVNNILLQIPLPCKANLLYSEYKVIEIEILYKESNALAVQSVDTIKIENLTSEDSFVVYNYQGVKPYKTLPEADLVRVFDKVPVRAHGQELISNRIVYSNFQTQHTPPESLNYNVLVDQKIPFDVSNNNKTAYFTSEVEYPEHTVKQNRNYQVGIVLSDKFGRSSTVILSSSVDQVSITDVNGQEIFYGGSTFYAPYAPDPGTGNNNVNTWSGDSLKVLFNQTIGSTGVYAGAPDLLTGWPGLYNGDKTSADYNPLGWYSYKIVVKQQEQEYYNVYLPGIVNGYPGDIAGPFPDPPNTVSFITLLSDNINKVPRDLREVGPLEAQFRSTEHASEDTSDEDIRSVPSASLKLYGRVTPEQTATGTATGSPAFNAPYYPQVINKPVDPNVVNTIGPENTLLDSSVIFPEIYQTDTNPLIARVSQTFETLSTGIGNGAIGSGAVAAGTVYNILLGVYETAPVESNLEIFWETSTSGLIEDLNLAIEEGLIPNVDPLTVASPAIKGLTSDGTSLTWTYNQSESTPANNNIIGGGTNTLGFIPYIQPGGVSGGITEIQNSTISKYWITDGLGNDRTDDFELVIAGSGRYNIKTKKTFYYGNDASTKESYTFNFQIYNSETLASDGGGLTSTVTAVGALSNAAPSFSNCVGLFDLPENATTIYSYDAVNGSADTTANKLDLTFSLVSQSPATPVVSINPDTGVLTEPTGTLNGPLDVIVNVKDASGADGALSADCPTTFNGSQGIATNDVNESFYNGKFLTINQGPESSGFYWSTDKTNEVSSTPLPGGSISFRAPVNNQPIPTDTIGGSGSNADTIPAQGACGSGGGLTSSWTWTNTNRNALAFSATNLNPTGLTSGTAYIMVDFYNTVTSEGAPQDDKPSLIWPTYLQYRDPSGPGYPNNWVDAVDVEGKTIKFGGTQTNNYSITNDSLRPDFTDTGVMDQALETISDTDGNYVKTDAMQVQTTGKKNSSSSSLFAQGRRIFAFGKDQGYGQTPDYFGDYRLVVRYPYGDNIPNSLTSFGDKILPVLTPQSCPGEQGGTSSNSPYALYYQSLDNQQVKLSYGDFYNPLLDSVAPPSYFSYKISSQGSTNKENAKSLSPTQVVYAREWSFRYVTQFYANPELTTPYAGTTINEYYSYCASSDSSLNGSYGNEMSNTTNTIISGDKAPAGSSSNEDRRWIAQFDGDGKKIIATAEPVVYDQEEAQLPPTPPAGTPPLYNDRLLNTTGFGPFPQVVNNVSSNKVVVVWSGGASQTTFANTFVRNITNNLGGQTPAPFVGTFLKFYSSDVSLGYPEVAVTSLNISGTSSVSYIYENTSGQITATITNAQLLLSGGTTGSLPSSNYYYDYT